MFFSMLLKKQSKLDGSDQITDNNLNRLHNSALIFPSFVDKNDSVFCLILEKLSSETAVVEVKLRNCLTLNNNFHGSRRRSRSTKIEIRIGHLVLEVRFHIPVCGAILFSSMSKESCIENEGAGGEIFVDNQGNDGWLATHGKPKDKCDEDDNLPYMESLEINKKSTIVSISIHFGGEDEEDIQTWKNIMNQSV